MRAESCQLYLLEADQLDNCRELLASGKRSKIPPLPDVFSRVMRTRSGRVGVMAGWAWLGLHFFAR